MVANRAGEAVERDPFELGGSHAEAREVDEDAPDVATLREPESMPAMSR
jgi:hypothetical protein